MTHDIAYKVLTFSDWVALNAGTFQGSAIDIADGYIHLSTAQQLTETVDRHFAGQDDLIIAAVDLTALGDDVRWESSRHGQLFPHVYGPLRRGAITAWCRLQRSATGGVCLPTG